MEGKLLFTARSAADEEHTERWMINGCQGGVSATAFRQFFDDRARCAADEERTERWMINGCQGGVSATAFRQFFDDRARCARRLAYFLCTDRCYPPAILFLPTVRPLYVRRSTRLALHPSPKQRTVATAGCRTIHLFADAAGITVETTSTCIVAHYYRSAILTIIIYNK